MGKQPIVFISCLVIINLHFNSMSSTLLDGNKIKIRSSHKEILPMAFGRFLYSAKIGCKILAMFWSVFQECIPILIAFLLGFRPFTLFSIICAFFLTLVFLIVITF